MITAINDKSNDYKYREAYVSDAEAIHSLMKDAFVDYANKKENEEEVINSALQEKIKDVRKDLENNIVLVLCDGKKIIASLRLEKISEKRYLLKRFAVSPVYQNQGLGTMLFERAVDKLEQINAHYVQLYSSLEKKKLISFYKGLGFNCLKTDHSKGYERGLWVKTIK